MQKEKMFCEECKQMLILDTALTGVYDYVAIVQVRKEKEKNGFSTGEDNFSVSTQGLYFHKDCFIKIAGMHFCDKFEGVKKIIV